MINQRDCANRETVSKPANRRQVLRCALAATMAPTVTLATTGSQVAPSAIQHATEQWNKARADWWDGLERDVVGNFDTPEMLDASDRESHWWDEISRLEATTREDLLGKAMIVIQENLDELIADPYSETMVRGMLRDAASMGVQMKSRYHGELQV